MDKLIKVERQNDVLVVSSREVARNFEKRHNDVIEVIEAKVKNLTTENIVVKNYFIESEFTTCGECGQVQNVF